MCSSFNTLFIVCIIELFLYKIYKFLAIGKGKVIIFLCIVLLIIYIQAFFKYDKYMKQRIDISLENKENGRDEKMSKVYLNGVLLENFENLEKYRISINGINNELELNDFEGNAIIYISIDGSNCKFCIGKNNIVKNDLSINFWNVADQQVNGAIIKIGDDNFFNGSGNVIISPVNTKVEIGSRNLLAGSITIWGRNDHAIYDIRNGKKLNNDRNIMIGNDNWIGQNVTFLPGGSLINNCVVGYGTLVNKRFDKNNVLIAGVPAKIKRKHINWSRASLEKNIDYENNLKINY